MRAALTSGTLTARAGIPEVNAMTEGFRDRE